MLTTLERLTMKVQAPLARVLQAPQPLTALQEVQLSERKLLFTDRFAVVLAGVPSLTTLRVVAFRCTDSSAACLLQLPLLTTLEFVLSSHTMCPMSRPVLFDALRQCAQITSLTLSSWEQQRQEYQSSFVEDLTALLPCFRCLKRLRLACFFADRFARVPHCRLSDSVAGRFEHLRALEMHCFQPIERGSEMVAALTPPSAMLPRLITFNERNCAWAKSRGCSREVLSFAATDFFPLRCAPASRMDRCANVTISSCVIMHFASVLHAFPERLSSHVTRW